MQGRFFPWLQLIGEVFSLDISFYRTRRRERFEVRFIWLRKHGEFEATLLRDWDSRWYQMVPGGTDLKKRFCLRLAQCFVLSISYEAFCAESLDLGLPSDSYHPNRLLWPLIQARPISRA
jgi:hypothetical protein